MSAYTSEIMSPPTARGLYYVIHNTVGCASCERCDSFDADAAAAAATADVGATLPVSHDAQRRRHIDADDDDDDGRRNHSVSAAVGDPSSWQ